MNGMYYKELYSKKDGGHLPQLVIAENENMQSRFVVQKILELREEGIPLEEMAVLFRSSFLSFDLEIELTKSNIPFVKYGGFKFIETAHIKDMIAYLRVLENPRDIVSWNRILLLIDGVGPRTAEKVTDDIVHHKVNFSGRGSDAIVSEKYWEGFHGYPEGVRKLFDRLRDVSSSKMTPSEKTNQIVGYYEPILKSRYDDHPKRAKDLEMFQNIAERYNDVESFLADLALEPPTESVVDIESPGKEEEMLVLSTIHSAKGLEWKVVFVIYALEGRFPSMRALTSEEEMEEELRLMYVACTRAKDHLFITYPINIFDRESGTVLSKPSRFIQGIDEKLLEPWIVE
ncbi:MAG TPA: ATP-dependent helicase [Bacteroidota bacterium]|nr:ATP-dependent helicase [Bacteroidota bacterium]